jgi:hypothetical protein
MCLASGHAQWRLEDSLVDLIQWPAMAVTVLAAWLVGARSPRRRKFGFWFFLSSNVLWIAWGWSAHAYALVVLQVALAIMNIRGAKKNEPPSGTDQRAVQ